MGGDAGHVAEIFQAVLEIGDIRPVQSTLILDEGIVRRQQHRGLDMGAAQLGESGIALPDQGGHGLGVLAQGGQGGVERLATLGIPFGTVNVDQPPRAFDIHQIEGMGSQHRQVDLEDFRPLAQFKIVEEPPDHWADGPAEKRWPAAPHH